MTIQIGTVTLTLLPAQFTTAAAEAAMPGGEAVERENDDLGSPSCDLRHTVTMAIVGTNHSFVRQSGVPDSTLRAWRLFFRSPSP